MVYISSNLMQIGTFNIPILILLYGSRNSADTTIGNLKPSKPRMILRLNGVDINRRPMDSCIP